MKILEVINGYAGIGGNRKYWNNVNVTAIELDPNIAKVYQELNKEDRVIIMDVKEHLLKNVKKYGFGWFSPSCQENSKMIRSGKNRTLIYPDLTLYELIIFLKHNFNGLWIVENVIPYYEPLIKPSYVFGRHLIWCNFKIEPFELKSPENFIMTGTVKGSEKLKEWLGIHYKGNLYYKGNHDPCQVLRNCVHPKLGKHIFDCAMNKYDDSQIYQGTLFQK